MSAYPRTERKAFLIFLLVLLALFVLILKPFLIPLLLSVVLVIVFYPFYEWGLKIFRGRRYLASILATLLLTILLFVPGTLIASLVASQLYGVVDLVIQFINRGELVDLFQKWNFNFQQYLTSLEETFRIQINLKTVVANAVQEVAYTLYRYSPGVLAQTVTFFVEGFIMLIVVFFLFVEGKGIYNELLLISPLKDSHEHSLALEIRSMIYAVVYGSFVTALVQGILAGSIFYFLGIRGYMVWAALTFLFSFIPIIGAGGVWVPMAVILFLLGDIKSGLILTFYGALLISGVDNILKPLLMRGKSRIHPLLLFLSILGGMLLAGPIGILLGPVTVAVLLASLKIYKQDYLPASGSS